jgi:hypothetical protein
MHKRTLGTLLVPVALAACAEAPTAPQAAVDGAHVATSALSAVSDARMMDLSVALADARVRLLPAVDAGVDATPLQGAMRRLDERLAAEDADGVMEAAAQVEAAMAAIPAGEAEEIMAELDAVRLALAEVRASAAGPVALQ